MQGRLPLDYNEAYGRGLCCSRVRKSWMPLGKRRHTKSAKQIFSALRVSEAQSGFLCVFARAIKNRGFAVRP